MVTADEPTTCLNADMDCPVCMMLRGAAVDLMVAAAPDVSTDFVEINPKGKKVLCLKLSKALCGCLQSALFWCNTLKKLLLKEGFVTNFVRHLRFKQSSGKQFTVV